MVDIDNMIDYLQGIFYTGNFDAPTSSFGGNSGVNNFYAFVAQERFQKRVDEIDLAIIAESARWGDAQSWMSNNPFTRDTWEAEINDIYCRFFPYRTDIVLNQLIEADLYPTFDPPVFKRDNVVLNREVYLIPGNTKVAISSTYGQILYTLDGTDPRLIGGKTSASAKEIESGGSIDLQGTTLINARVKFNDEWSA